MRWGAAQGAERLRRPTAAVALVLALIGAGCGGGGEGLTQAARERLAARSDAVAARLETGDACAARRAAVQLRRDAQQLLAGGGVSAEAAAELRARVSSLVRAIVCVPPPPPPAVVVPAVEDEDDEDEDRGKKKEKKEKKPREGHGRGKGARGDDGEDG